MSVLDAALGATIPIIAGTLVWAGRQFVTQTVGQTGARGPIGPSGPAGSMTITDYHELADLLMERFNGRYLLASDARAMFDRIERKIDQLAVFPHQPG